MLTSLRSCMPIALLAALVTLSACGGGGGGGSGGGGTGGGGTGTGGSAGSCGTAAASAAIPSGVYLAGEAGNSVPIIVPNGGQTNRANLVAFDPQNLNLQTVLANAGTYSNELGIEYGTYNSATQSLGQPYIGQMVFVQNGKFFKVDLRKGGAGLTPVQVSNETSADNLCSVRPYRLVDYVNPDNTTLLYSQPGPNGTCDNTAGSDDVWKIIKLGMSATTAPLAAKPLVVGLHNTSGAAVGWLAINGTSLTRYDDSFANPSPLTSITAGTDVFELTLHAGGVEKAMVDINNTLQIYDCATTVSPQPITSFNGVAIHGTATDESALYVAQTDATGSNIRRFGYDGSVPAAPLTNDPALPNLVGITTSANRVVYVVVSNPSRLQLKSVLKTGSNSTPTILKFQNAVDFSGTSGAVVAVNNNIYFNVDLLGPVSGNTPYAVVRSDDGTGSPSETAQARWLNLTFGTGGSSNPPNVSSISSFAHLIRAENVTSTASAGQQPVYNYSGATIKSCDPATCTSFVTLGTMPGGTIIDRLSFDRNATASLGQALRSSVTLPGAFTADIYAVNPNTAGSLTRITTNIP